MTDFEKIEYIENEMIDTDMYTETQLDAIEGLIYWLADFKHKDNTDNIMLESLENLFQYTTGWEIEYTEDEEEEEI